MTKEWINRTIKEHHAAMIEKGFYPDDEEKNIGELLMLIVSELGEALEAHRCSRFAVGINKVFEYDTNSLDFTKFFVRNIKDTFEDEIADVFLRLFDLCGYLVEEENYDLVLRNYETSCQYFFGRENIGEFFIYFIKGDIMTILDYDHKNYIPAGAIGRSLAELKMFCDKQSIPIKKHIEAKMAYNKTRPIRHGKNY